MHNCKYGCVVPETNAVFWKAKRERNAARDRLTEEKLRNAGWKILTVWECETKPAMCHKLPHRLKGFLSLPLED